jgi:hypothetical protein
MDVWTYFQQRERDCEDLSLHPFGDFWDMVAEEEGSEGKRGRIFGAFAMTDEIHLHVSEVVVVKNDHIHREEYGYFLTNEGVEIFGEERDLSHDPAVHRHVGPDHERQASEPIAFREFVERAWDEVSRIHEHGD